MMLFSLLGKGRRNRETQKPGTQLVNYIKKENFYCFKHTKLIFSGGLEFTSVFLRELILFVLNNERSLI